jgi:hypothetical protein
MPYQLDWKGKVTAAVRAGYRVDILDGAIIQQTPGVVFFTNAIPMPPTRSWQPAQNGCPMAECDPKRPSRSGPSLEVILGVDDSPAIARPK